MKLDCKYSSVTKIIHAECVSFSHDSDESEAALAKALEDGASQDSAAAAENYDEVILEAANRVMQATGMSRYGNLLIIYAERDRIAKDLSNTTGRVKDARCIVVGQPTVLIHPVGTHVKFLYSTYF